MRKKQVRHWMIDVEHITPAVNKKPDWKQSELLEAMLDTPGDITRKKMTA